MRSRRRPHRAALAFALLGAVAACGDQAKERRCDGEVIKDVPSPWRELEVSAGDVCRADPQVLTFIVTNAGDTIAVAESIKAKLVAKGWTAEPMPTPSVNSAGSESVTDIFGWGFTRDGSPRLTLDAKGFLPSKWKNTPVEVSLSMR